MVGGFPMSQQLCFYLFSPLGEGFAFFYFRHRFYIKIHPSRTWGTSCMFLFKSLFIEYLRQYENWNKNVAQFQNQHELKRKFELYEIQSRYSILRHPVCVCTRIMDSAVSFRTFRNLKILKKLKMPKMLKYQRLLSQA